MINPKTLNSWSVLEATIEEYIQNDNWYYINKTLLSIDSLEDDQFLLINTNNNWFLSKDN